MGMVSIFILKISFTDFRITVQAFLVAHACPRVGVGGQGQGLGDCQGLLGGLGLVGAAFGDKAQNGGEKQAADNGG